MKILRIAFLNSMYIFGIGLLVSFVLVNMKMANAEIRLPKLDSPSVQIPDMPAIPAPDIPQMPTMKIIDTDKISAEIDEHAAADAKDNKEDINDKASSKSNQPDKIRDNKYIKRDDTKSSQGDKQQENEIDSANPNDMSDKSAQKDNAAKQVTAQQLLSAGFIALMFYIFSKTAFIAIVCWLAFLKLIHKISVILEMLAFAMMNVLAGLLYFPLAGNMDGQKLEFYEKTITMNDFFMIMFIFTLCAVATVGVLSIVIMLYKKVFKGGLQDGQNTQKFI